MFSAVYLVCMLGKPCESYTDLVVYSTYQECVVAAEEVMAMNQERVARGVFLEHTAEFQCISWGKA